MNDYYAFKEKRRKEKEKQSKYYDQHTKEMKELRSGEVVRMLTDEKWKPATVLKKSDEPRNCIMQTDNGRNLRQNRSHEGKTEGKS